MYYAFFDTETSGLSFTTDRVCEFAAIKTDENFNILETLHLYINPTISLPQVAIDVHGLTDEFLADKPIFEDVADQIIAFMEGTHAVAHNAPYDVGMLNAEFTRIGIGKFEVVPAHIEDSADLSRTIMPGRPANLDAICDRFKVDRSRRVLHGALMDCELLIEAYKAMLGHKDKVVSALEVLLGINPFEPAPEALSADATEEERENYLATLARNYGLVSGLESLGKKFKDKFSEPIKKEVKKVDFVTSRVQIKFSPREAIDWDAVRKEHLEGIDLDEFKDSSLTCRIKSLEI